MTEMEKKIVISQLADINNKLSLLIGDKTDKTEQNTSAKHMFEKAGFEYDIMPIYSPRLEVSWLGVVVQNEKMRITFTKAQGSIRVKVIPFSESGVVLFSDPEINCIDKQIEEMRDENWLAK